MDTWFEVAPTCDGFSQILSAVSKKLSCHPAHIIHVVKKMNLQQLAKEQKKEITEEIYAEKIPLAKRVVGLSLEAAAIYLQDFQPKNIQEAQTCVTMATQINNLLRLELGKSTENVEILHRAERPLVTILESLQKNDPFVQYPQPQLENNTPETVINLSDPKEEEEAMLNGYSEH